MELALQGDIFVCMLPRALPWARSALSGRVAKKEFFTLHSSLYCPPSLSKKVMISSKVLNSSLPYSIVVPMKPSHGLRVDEVIAVEQVLLVAEDDVVVGWGREDIPPPRSVPSPCIHGRWLALGLRCIHCNALSASVSLVH